MKKFEYKAVSVNRSGNAMKPIMEDKVLNNNGGEGWRLVTTCPDILKTGLILFFEREITVVEEVDEKKPKKGKLF